MKKLIIPAFMAMAVLASCGGNSQQKNSDNSSDAATESVAKSEASSSDLTFFELHGPVQKLVDGDGELAPMMIFDEKGTLLSIDGDTEIFTREQAVREYDEETDNFYESPKLTRNSNGQICQVDYVESGTTYIWENNKVVRLEWAAEGSEGVINYTYNQDGELIEECEQVKDITEEDYSNSDDPHCVKYKITKRDSHNNWIEREAYCDDPFTEIRYIEYFE